MKYYKLYNTLYVVINGKDLKQLFENEMNFQVSLNRIYKETLYRNCIRIKILNEDKKR